MVRWLVGAWLVLCASVPSALAACMGPEVRPVAPGVWWVAGETGDTQADNRGRIANVLAVADGARLWLVGAGPTPVAGRALACVLHQATGRRVTDLVLPWPRAELTLGASAFEGARRWAHEEVAGAMRTRCPRCVARLTERLGSAAAEMGSDPVRLPDRLLRGAQGRVGPFDWWRVYRSDDTAVLVLRVRGTALWSAHGLLWSDGPPDLRDASLSAVAGSLAWLAHLGRGEPAARWLPEQGPWQGPALLASQQQYLRALRLAVQRAQDAGQLETERADTLPGVAPALTHHVRHELNWQRVWSLLEREPGGWAAD